jgi:glycosyltransferase involved in cell wall biosynthesis
VIGTLPRYTVVQLGARMHYAVPMILHREGWLDRLYTDVSATGMVMSTLALLGGVLPSARAKRFAGRRLPDIPSRRVRSFPAFGVRYALRSSTSRTRGEQWRTYLWANEAFGSRVAAAGFGRSNAVYAFNTSAYEVLTAARARGLFTVLEQTIAPLGIEQSLLQAERERHPGWEAPAVAASDVEHAFEMRERSEWALADRILCGSEFVMDTLCASGVDRSRCAIVPYGVSIEDFETPMRQERPGTVRALTVGTLGLRKGTPYVLGAARRLRGLVRFRLVGLAPLPSPVLAELGAATDLAGPVPRVHMRDEFARADIFVLPSVCEGSATATYEALAAGLPVICTPNAGSMVRDGVDGFVVPPGNLDALTARVEQLARNPSLRAAMSESARQRARQLSLRAYSDRLLVQLGSAGAAA